MVAMWRASIRCFSLASGSLAERSLLPALATISAPGKDLTEDEVFSVLVDLLLFAEREENIVLERGMVVPLPLSLAADASPQRIIGDMAALSPSSEPSSTVGKGAILVMRMADASS